MHRNTFINGPQHLGQRFKQDRRPLFFADQITGVKATSSPPPSAFWSPATSMPVPQRPTPLRTTPPSAPSAIVAESNPIATNRRT
jgi:hypothetical protein